MSVERKGKIREHVSRLPSYTDVLSSISIVVIAHAATYLKAISIFGMAFKVL